MIKVNKRKILKWLALITWMIIIYHFSNTPNSGDETLGIIEKIIPTVKSTNTLETINYIIRKLAHITEYFILAYLANSLIKEYTKKKTNFLTLIFCLIYAITDEFHQSLVIGRTATPKDVIIDQIGTSIYLIINYLKSKKTTSK